MFKNEKAIEQKGSCYHSLYRKKDFWLTFHPYFRDFFFFFLLKWRKWPWYSYFSTEIEIRFTVNHFQDSLSSLCREWGTEVSFLPKGCLPICLFPYSLLLYFCHLVSQSSSQQISPQISNSWWKYRASILKGFIFYGETPCNGGSFLSFKKIHLCAYIF